MTAAVRVLTFTSLYPSSARPRHGIFIESRLRRLASRGGLRSRVIAPVPWFPLRGERWGEYGRMGATPGQETRAGIEVSYPRYPMIPRIGMPLQPAAMAWSGWRAVQALQRRGEAFDLIDAHYLYPDAVAAAPIARRLGCPFIATARGSDVNVIAQLPGPRERILRALEASAAIVAVSAALKASLVGMGVPAARITVLRNGVDTELFQPVVRSTARRELGLPIDGRIIACVGNLVPGKRTDLALEAAARIKDATIVFVGRGSERARLQRLGSELSMTQRMQFFDEMPQQRLRDVYSAADALVLASEREGWPNVLLESVACGTPVVAFNVGGVPEILTDPAAGIIVRGGHDAGLLAEALGALFAHPPAREAVRAAAVRFSWDPVLDAQLALYRRVAGLSAGAGEVVEMAAQA